jgi:hypothetical protein
MIIFRLSNFYSKGRPVFSNRDFNRPMMTINRIGEVLCTFGMVPRDVMTPRDVYDNLRPRLDSYFKIH